MNKKESGATERGGQKKKMRELAIWSMQQCRVTMISQHLLPEGSWIEKSKGAYIIRSAFFSIPRTIDEIIEHSFSHMSESSIDRIGQLTLLLKS